MSPVVYLFLCIERLQISSHKQEQVIDEVKKKASGLPTLYGFQNILIFLGGALELESGMVLILCTGVWFWNEWVNWIIAVVCWMSCIPHRLMCLKNWHPVDGLFWKLMEAFGSLAGGNCVTGGGLLKFVRPAPLPVSSLLLTLLLHAFPTVTIIPS